MRFFKKKRFSLGRVYAGPDPKPAPEVILPPKKGDEFEMNDVYAGPEQMEERANRHTRRAEFVCVYAGPEMFDRNTAVDLSANNPFNQAPYPFNNACEEEEGENRSASLRESDMSAGAKAETVICPVCGNETRCGKFCEHCGSLLPRPEANE